MSLSRTNANIRHVLDGIYYRLEDLIDPGTINSEHIYADTVRSSVQQGTVWLDVGCGHSIFPGWLPSAGTAADLVKKCSLVVGIDFDFESLLKHDSIRNLVNGDFACAPYKDSSFDCITANMVMEHVSDPVQALKTVERLLKPNGIFVFHTPNYWHYWTFLSTLVPQFVKNKLIELAEGRKEEDVFPTFYRLNTIASINRVANQTGLQVQKLSALSSSSTAAMIILGPFVVIDLLLRRLTRFEFLKNFRANFIVVLQKPASSHVRSEQAAG